MRSRGPHRLALALLLLTTAGCSGGAGAPDDPGAPTVSTAPGDSAEPSSPGTAPTTGFSVTSADFVDGGPLGDDTTATGFGGQCTGANLSPQLSWTGAPAGTSAFAVAMVDLSAGDWVHWLQADVAGTTTEVTSGGSATLDGVTGRNGRGGDEYFGPCPPGPDHEYEITVYALDALLGLEPGFSYSALGTALEGHVLASASITGLRSGPSAG